MTRGLEQGIAESIRDAALRIERGAKDRCPVDTGNLKNSIQARQQGRLTWLVGSWNTEYNVYVEFGTRRMAAQPYLRPAAEEVRLWFRSEGGRIVQLRLVEALGAMSDMVTSLDDTIRLLQAEIAWLRGLLM